MSPSRVSLRLPLLTLRNGETKRLPAIDISKLLGVCLPGILPVDLSLDEAWANSNKGFNFVVYFEMAFESARKHKPNYRFRLVEKQSLHPNWENILDVGTAEKDIKWKTSPRFSFNNHGVIEVRSRRLGRYKLVVPPENFGNFQF